MKNIEGALKLLSEYIGEFGGGCGDNSLGISSKFRVLYAQQELAELKLRLKEIAQITDQESGNEFCPACREHWGEHSEDCWLSIAIGVEE